MTTNTSKPTLVFVHGAFADSSSWNAVIGSLLAQGYPIIAVANPLRSVKSDADYLDMILDSIDTPIVLIGHSYGGMAISSARNRNVRALVYVAGFAPAIGESAGDLSGLYPGSTLGTTLYEVALPNGDSDLYIMQDKFWKQFAADVPEAQALVMAATQRPATKSALYEASAAAAWKTVPSWFVFGELDRNIPVAAHHFMAQRAVAVETTEVKGASHVVMVSHPETVTGVIVAAAQSLLVKS